MPFDSHLWRNHVSAVATSHGKQSLGILVEATVLELISGNEGLNSIDLQTGQGCSISVDIPECEHTHTLLRTIMA